MSEAFTGVCTGHGAGLPPCERHHPGGYRDPGWVRQAGPVGRHAASRGDRYARNAASLMRARRVLAADAKTRRERRSLDSLAQQPPQPILGLR